MTCSNYLKGFKMSGGKSSSGEGSWRSGDRDQWESIKDSAANNTPEANIRDLLDVEDKDAGRHEAEQKIVEDRK